MQLINLDTTTMAWEPGSPLFGEGAIFNGRDVVHLKILSDRRQDGGGIAFLLRFTPPEGKVIKIVAVARSDEHIFNLEGGRGGKSGEQLRFPGNYALNPRGKVHSAFIGAETLALVVYAGEPDEIRSMEVLDAASS
ncbi:MAG TPA: hypothetical protein VND19_11760 [Acetobacteraceae bacterium]|nr:hypothetical protein [Acetobacteraceae bacterium]